MEKETVEILEFQDDLQIRNQFKSSALTVQREDFDQLALRLFRYQALANPLYAEFLSLLSVDPGSVKDICEIPFLPVQLFKKYKILSGKAESLHYFESSGTTSTPLPGRHYISDLAFYNEVSRLGFESQFGPLQNYCFLALLPSYLERGNSSLVHMVNHFINVSSYAESGFYLNDFKALNARLIHCIREGIPTILIGVSFALLDLAEQFPMKLEPAILMETGGMKGRRRELTRSELHAQLCTSFKIGRVYSEYGMTELLSQSYSLGDGIFQAAPTKRVLLREPTDPFAVSRSGGRGALNIIDLANIDSCAFIATDDLGIIGDDHRFNVLGRLDNSDLRGCNLMLDELRGAND